MDHVCEAGGRGRRHIRKSLEDSWRNFFLRVKTLNKILNNRTGSGPSPARDNGRCPTPVKNRLSHCWLAARHGRWLLPTACWLGGVTRGRLRAGPVVPQGWQNLSTGRNLKLLLHRVGREELSINTGKNEIISYLISYPQNNHRSVIYLNMKIKKNKASGGLRTISSWHRGQADKFVQMQKENDLQRKRLINLIIKNENCYASKRDLWKSLALFQKIIK